MRYSRRKNLSRTRAWSIRKNKKSIQRSFEEAMKDIQQKEPPKDMPGALYKLRLKPTSQGILDQISKINLLDRLILLVLSNLPDLPILLVLPNLLVLSN